MKPGIGKCYSCGRVFTEKHTKSKMYCNSYCRGKRFKCTVCGKPTWGRKRCPEHKAKKGVKVTMLRRYKRKRETELKIYNINYILGK